MAIQFPLSLPVVPNSYTLDRKSTNIVNVSPYTMQQQVVRGIGECWFLKLTFPAAVFPTDASNFGAFISSLRGMFGTFYFGPPKSRLLYTGTGAVTLTSINNDLRDNITCNMNGTTLQVGTFIQIGTQLCQIVTSTGGSTFDIFPFLRTAYASGTPVNHTTPVGIFRQKTSSGGSTTFNQDHTESFSLDAMEAM
jgi:hypothetical protein